jgi:hypothetical protein
MFLLMKNMRANGVTEKNMVKAHFGTPMEISILVTGSKIKRRAREFCITPLGPTTRVIGPRTWLGGLE